MNFTRGFDQHSSMLQKDEDVVYVADLKNDISTCIKELNYKIVVKDIYAPVNGNDIQASELQSVRIIICDTAVLIANYTKMPLLKWAHCTWAGVESLFTAIKSKPSFIVTRHGHEDFGVQMAEYVMAHVLTIEQQLSKVRDAQKRKEWIYMVAHSLFDQPAIRHLKEITLGILGAGNMGQAIAKFFKPHGTKVIGLAKSPRKKSEFGFFDSIGVSLTEVLSASDYIVNTLPSTPETIGLLDGDVLQTCKQRCVFINVGRGDIMQEDTVIKALEKDWIRHAVLDVFEFEPPPEDSALWDCDRVTITPHCAASSTPKNIAEDFVMSYFNFLHNQPMRNVVDWDKGY